MSSIDEIRDARIKKLKLLRNKGVNPYPAESKREISLQEAFDNFESLEAKKENKWIAGRIMSIRGQGAIVFITLNDGTGTFQGLLKKDVLGDEKFNFWNEVVDIGDFVEIQGIFFKTNRGEKTLEAKDWRMLSKSLRPLPEKWHGLVDMEERYRKRYVDLIMNPLVKDVFITRSKIVEAIREFLLKDRYLEVQTPILQPIYGGGSARPFVSKLNALDMPIYMRISNELYLKRLVVGGFEKVFEFSVDFRNEGIDRSHNPEFMLFEAMTAYKDYVFGMQIIEDITEYVVKKITGGTKIIYQNTELDFKKPWRRVSIRDAISEYAGIDIEKADDKKLKSFLTEHKIELTGEYVRGNAIMAISEEFCEKNFIQPTMLYDYPVETSPLAKHKASNPKYVERFEQYVFGMEVGNNYSELNDPGILESNWKEQEEALKKGDEEAQRMDKDFINALEVGMPATCGIAISIDRLTMLLTDQSSIRDVILFPFMRPEQSDKKPDEKKGMIIVAVLNKEAKMELWQELNTIAHLNAAFGARVGREDLFYRDTIISKDNHKIKLNIKNAIMIKVAPSGKVLRELLEKAKNAKLEVDEFTREMIETTSDKKVIEITAAKNFKDIEYLGVLIYGPKDVVENLTSDLKLY